jgi:hypothetical protein
MNTRPIVESIEGEYLRYKKLGEDAMRQLDAGQLTAGGPGGTNSIAIIAWHLAGNFQSRFTDFLTTDGEKPWRKREEEFAVRDVTLVELMTKWEAGWEVVLRAIAALSDADLGRQVTIRQQPLFVREALLRSLAHASYHVGQIVLTARAARGQAWTFLSIPPGKSDEYNRAPDKERPPKR